MTARSLSRRAALAAVLCVPFAPVQAQAALKKVKLSLIPATGQAAIYVAIEKGFFRAEGLDVETVNFDAGPPSAVAVTSGDVQIGSVGPSAAMFNMAAQGQLKLIGGGYAENAAIKGVAVVASEKAYQAGLKGFQDLKIYPNLRIGITAAGASLHYQTSVVAKKFGLDLATAKVVQLGSVANIASALAGGSVDLALLPGLAARNQQAKGGVQIIGYLSEISSVQHTIFITSTKLAANEPDTVRAFLRGYKKGAQFYNDAMQSKDSAQRDEVATMVAKYTRQSLAVQREDVIYGDPDAKLDLAGIAGLAAWLQQHGMVQKTFELRSVVDPVFVPEIATFK